MQFKWVSYYSKLCNDNLKNWIQGDRNPDPLPQGKLNPPFAFNFLGLLTRLLLFILFTLGTVSSLALASVKIKPNSGGAQGGSNGGGGTYYYYVQYSGSSYNNPDNVNRSNPSPNVAFFDSNNPLYIIDAPSSSSSLPFEFQVTSDKAITVPSGQQTVLSLLAFNQDANQSTPITIATVNGAACDDSKCSARDNSTPAKYRAVRYTPNTTITVGFFATALCSDYNTASGCNNSNFPVNPTPGNRTVLKIAFQVALAPDTFATTAPPGNPVDQMTGPVNLSLGQDTPALACPSLQTLSNSYYPGDGQIFLNTTGFGLNSASGGSNLVVPAAAVYAYGMLDSGKTKSPTILNNITSAGPSGYSIISNLELGSNQPITGLQNSTDSEEYNYFFTFAVRDQAGIYATLTPATSCYLGPVTTAEIQGFLKKGSCFIATAAFRSIDTPPVQMLRAFRDQVLLNYDLGQKFVQLYYSWSPGSAEWLLLHPIFRFPILIFLSPLELVAWIFLNPCYLFIPFGVLIGLGVICLKRYLRRKLSLESNVT